MDSLSNIPNVASPTQPEVDPVQRSLAKPDAFAKPASFKSVKSTKPTRIRTMDWKRTRGRPRKRPFDPRKVHFF